MQKVNNSGEGTVMFWQQYKAQVQDTQNFQDNWCGTDTGMENFLR
jgi:hypothetical protein